MFGLCPLGRSRLFSSRSALARPPASSLPARTPRARPLRPAPPPSELEPVAAAPGFPQCTARRSSHPIPSSRVRPPRPRRRGPDPIPSRRARDSPRPVSWTSVSLAPAAPGPWGPALCPQAPAIDSGRRTQDPRSRGAQAELLLQRASQPVCLEWHLLSLLLTQRGRHNDCYHFPPPQPMQTSRAPQSHLSPSTPPPPRHPSLSLGKSPQQTFSVLRPITAHPAALRLVLHHDPRSLDLLCARKPLATSIERMFTIEPVGIH